MIMVEAGRIEFTLGEETVIAQAGDMVWAPRGWVHTLRIKSEWARMAVWMTPGGFEQFFVESAQLGRAGEASPAAIVALSERFGLTFVAPSGGLPEQ